MTLKLESISIKAYINNILSSFSCCDLCGENIDKNILVGILSSQTLLCKNCVGDLPYFKQSLIAGNLLNWPAIHHALPKIHFEYLFSLSPYRYPFNQWLAQLKYSGRFELADFFGALLCTQWRVMKIQKNLAPVDLVVSVPLHVKKWQVRGYNQAHLIAKYFTRQLCLAYDPNLVVRIKNNDSQMGKKGKERRKNLMNAFVLQKELASHIKHVLIIDDVVTTGSTVSEICKVLKKSGVETVTLVTVCLTLPKKIQ
jgi:ComF family protein